MQRGACGRLCTVRVLLAAVPAAAQSHTCTPCARQCVLGVVCVCLGSKVAGGPRFSWAECDA
jgi:hypothetical protein